MAELVGGDAGREGVVAALRQQLVGCGDDGPDDALAGVVLVAAAARSTADARDLLMATSGEGDIASETPAMP